MQVWITTDVSMLDYTPNADPNSLCNVGQNEEGDGHIYDIPFLSSVYVAFPETAGRNPI